MNEINFIEIQKILIYFIIYSFIGWILESTLKTVISKKFISSGFLFGSVCPIYGFGAIIMILFLSKYNDNTVILFFSSFVILSLWEYVVGLCLEKIFHTTYWDYSQNKFNIQGRVCLQNSIYWGILGVLFVNYIHPFVALKVENIPYQTLLILNIIMYLVLVIDMICSTYKTIGFNKQLKILDELTNNTKIKIEELLLLVKSDNQLIKKHHINELRHKIKAMRMRELRIRIKLEKNLNDLKNSFPGIKSEKISKLLEKSKREYSTLKQKLRKKENK